MDEEAINRWHFSFLQYNSGRKQENIIAGIVRSVRQTFVVVPLCRCKGKMHSVNHEIVGEK